MEILNYLNKIQNYFHTGISTEHTYRNDLQNLIACMKKDISVINEPKHQKCGAPDFIIQIKDIPIGYAETKDIGTNLDKTEKSEQLERYISALDNFILTDYLEFRFFLFGKKVRQIKIGEVIDGKIKLFSENYDLLKKQLIEFCSFKGQTIKSSQKLAGIMAQKARLMKDVIFKIVSESSEKNTLKNQLDSIRQVLITNLGEKAFSDIYAQTIAYGLFAARLNDSTLSDFSRQEALFLVPKTNPFLRQLFTYVAGPELDERVVWIVNDLADILRATDIKTIISDFGKIISQNDPFLHFYETFLSEYDEALRKLRGVYYTPEPVVNFIVRAVDEILTAEFKLDAGIADTGKIEIEIEKAGYSKRVKEKVHRVQILDPAAGTGAFLSEIVKQIYKKFENQKGVWNSYVENNLIPRLHGFEILMAPYTMCHLKIEMMLRQLGYQSCNTQQRLRVFLTNSLQEAHPDTGSLFTSWLANEANEANIVKRDTPVMVVLGNPPYSGHSANKGEWIEAKLDDYKKEPSGGKLQEKNPKWINDDYVKFIRFGELLIEKNNEGILAFINNHSFLDNPTFRGMRWHLLNTFDKIYIIDLHGNTKKKEICPDGSLDQNVFDIQQGVSINIFVKTSRKKKNELAEVYAFDLFGSRDYKSEFLLKHNLKNIKFKKLQFCPPQYYFTYKDFSSQKKFNKGFSINELFKINSVGIVTARDEFTIKFNSEDLKKSIADFLRTDDEIARIKFNLGKDAQDWTIKTAKNDLEKTWPNFKLITEINYRPFDTRYTYYTGNSKGFHCRARENVMRHFLNGPNLGLISIRRSRSPEPWREIFATNKIIAGATSISALDINYLFPLYLYPEFNLQRRLFGDSGYERIPNLNSEIIKRFSENLNLKFSNEKENSKNTFAPVDVFDYIYAILHSNGYREKYKEFLKTDFARVPYPADKKQFWHAVKFGAELRQLHLLESDKLKKFITAYPKNGDNVITRSIRQSDFEMTDLKKRLGRIWINDYQYFEGIPFNAWNYFIGGYQPAQKWLKDRRGKALTVEEIFYYQKIISALFETEKIINEIDHNLKI
ncbi:MAG TPA: N-6 DNA methylase [bacterium]|nr:N-6 DNA methylase [bacterium]HPN30725.1 N-6 DNA methylase [bacterium]